MTLPLISAIDVSAWQGAIDWPAVAASGVKAAFVKASEGASGEHSRDARFDANMAGCVAAGLVAVPYHFFTAAPPEDQATNFLDALHDGFPWLGAGSGATCPASTSGRHEPDDERACCFACGEARAPIATMLDLERSGSPGTDLGARALAWLGIVEAALGCNPWIYLSPYFAAQEHLVRHPDLAACPLLLARWQEEEPPAAPAPWDAWSGWQQGKGYVPGVRGDCDLDVLRRMP